MVDGLAKQERLADAGARRGGAHRAAERRRQYQAPDPYAIVYLTLGVMLMRVAERRITKLYCLGIAVLVRILVWSSRVHYPTDVLGGWMLGFLWASICWLTEQQFDTTAGVAEERDKAG